MECHSLHKDRTMMTYRIKFLIFLSLVVGVPAQNNVLESPIVSDFGGWGPWEYCPGGDYAVGFQLLTESWVGPLGDDTTLNGIRLLCGKPGDQATSGSPAVSSTVGQWGSWGVIFSCRGLVNGFQLRSEIPDQVDNTAANNLRGFCSANEQFVEGDGERFGDWTLAQQCATQQALCGIQTQVQPFQDAFTDDTALNNLRTDCCQVENPGTICTPSDELILLIRCNNTGGTDPITCIYQYNFGLSYVAINSASEAYESIGFNLENVGGELLNNYVANFGTSPTTGHNWTDAPLGTWIPETSDQGSVIVDPGSLSEIFQVSGNCGIFTIGTDTFKEVVTKKGNEVPVSRTFTISCAKIKK